MITDVQLGTMLADYIAWLYSQYNFTHISDATLGDDILHDFAQNLVQQGLINTYNVSHVIDSDPTDPVPDLYVGKIETPWPNPNATALLTCAIMPKTSSTIADDDYDRAMGVI